MYDGVSTPVVMGVGGTLALTGIGTGWLLMAVFVLAMSGWALLQTRPKNMVEVRKVNPAASRVRRTPDTTE